MSSMLDAALWYADLGYPVFPCRPGEKVPLTQHGLKDATTDPDIIEAWWNRTPEANVAICTDGLVAIDIDGNENPWLADQPGRLHDLAAAPTSLTPRGGRQHLFRQPAGKAWRNTAGRLAPNVDTRANGGYICVTPSVVNGTGYRWTDAQSLHIPPEQLPEPPGWLVRLLDEPVASVTVTASDPTTIPEGHRNDTLARFAGYFRRAGMNEREIAAALDRINLERCHPPVDRDELRKIAASIARYAPDSVTVALVENHWDQMFTGFEAENAYDLMDRLPNLREPVIHGLLRRGETMNVIAPPKTGKSWLVLGLAMTIAAGKPWLGTYTAEHGRVLILDNELHGETIANRIPKVADALGISRSVLRSIDVVSLRGILRDLVAMGPSFDKIEAGRYDLIILDAFYRFLPVGTDENSNADVATLYNRLDAHASRIGCAFALVHHSSKGVQGGKSVTDVGAGAGSQSRATDTHLVLRAHEEPGAVVLDAAVRSWPPIDPVALRFTFPIWQPAPDLDPAALKVESVRRRKPAPKTEADPEPEWTVARFVESFVRAKPRLKVAIVEEAAAAGLSVRQADTFLKIAEDEGVIHRTGGVPHRGGARYSTEPVEGSDDT